MNYYYLIRVRYIKGNQFIIKDYKKSFLEVGQLFVYLESEHKDNYTLMSIKTLK